MVVIPLLALFLALSAFSSALPNMRKAGRVLLSSASKGGALRHSRFPDARKYGHLNLMLRDVDGQDRFVNVLDTAGGSGEDLGAGRTPLMILGGTAQTIDTYTGHFRELGKGERRLIVVELRNQGKTQLLSAHGHMDQLVEDVAALLRALKINQVDLCGFSFGGRVALAVASAHPEAVRRLSITGVPLHREPLGVAILQSWSDGLNHGQLRACAWSFLLNGYSEAFLTRFADRLPSFVTQICEDNDCNKLADLMNLSHITSDAHFYSVPSCAARLACPTQVIAASLDRIAAPGTVLALANSIKHSEFHEIQGSGHLVPFEQPTRWRRSVLQFLDA